MLPHRMSTVDDAIAAYDSQTAMIERAEFLEPGNCRAALEGAQRERERIASLSHFSQAERERINAAIDRLEAALRRHVAN